MALVLEQNKTYCPGEMLLIAVKKKKERGGGGQNSRPCPNNPQTPLPTPYAEEERAGMCMHGVRFYGARAGLTMTYAHPKRARTSGHILWQKRCKLNGQTQR